jgi:peptide deformylase
VLVNPVLTPTHGDETFANYEGCLSVPNLRGGSPRATEVRCQAWDRHGNPVDEVVHGPQGRHLPARGRSPARHDLRRPRDRSATFATWTEFDRHHRAAFVDEAKAIVAKYGS